MSVLAVIARLGRRFLCRELIFFAKDAEKLSVEDRNLMVTHVAENKEIESKE